MVRAMTMDSVTIPDAFDNMRLDRALAALLPEVSRTRLKNLIESGQVMLDGAVVDTPSFKVRGAQVVALDVPAPEAAEPAAQDIPLDIVYEDDDLLVLNKPAGLVVHPAAGHSDGTLVNALLHHCEASLSGIGGVRRPGIVHRLDKDTSGLMLVAKNDLAHAGLAAQLADRTMSRTYQALVWGVPTPPKGRIDAALGRNPNNRFYMQVRGDGRAAVTNYTVLARYGVTAALVECRLETGRTHQIRVHMAHIKHPVLGDPLYGIPQSAVDGYLKRAEMGGADAQAIKGFDRQALHAVAIRFIHPRSEKQMQFSIELPNEINRLVKILSKLQK